MQASIGGQSSPATANDAARAAALRQFLIQRIGEAGGAIGFAEFMQHALYAPGLGYYVAGATPFGERGDFVTAPEISPLFGRTLALVAADILDACGGDTLLELGAGSGALATAILGWFAEARRPLRYRILDVSPALVRTQREEIEALDLPAIVDVDWIEEPAQPIDGVILANEVADALPVERFSIAADGHVLQTIVTVTPQRELALATRPAPEPLAAAVRAVEADTGATLPAGYRSEICLALGDWIARIGGWLARGAVVIGDYGLGRREYYSPSRLSGTFLCHSRHRVHDDPLRAPGLTDMTAWVDFTAVAESGLNAGLSLFGFTPQAQFLLHAGIGSVFDESRRLDPRHEAALAAEMRTLILPGEMGERFRFLGLERGMMRPVRAFGGTDLRHTL